MGAADDLCASEALAAGLEGEFVAVLPTKGLSAIGCVVSDGRPVVRADGVVLAESEEAFGMPNWSAPLSVLASPGAQLGLRVGGLRLHRRARVLHLEVRRAEARIPDRRTRKPRPARCGGAALGVRVVV